MPSLGLSGRFSTSLATVAAMCFSVIACTILLRCVFLARLHRGPFSLSSWLHARYASVWQLSGLRTNPPSPPPPLLFPLDEAHLPRHQKPLLTPAAPPSLRSLPQALRRS